MGCWFNSCFFGVGGGKEKEGEGDFKLFIKLIIVIIKSIS